MNNQTIKTVYLFTCYYKSVKLFLCSHLGICKIKDIMKPFKKNYRYPWEVIKKALTMYHKSDSISFREVSKKLEDEEIYVSYKTIYDWNRKLGKEYDTKLNELQDMIKK